MAKSYSEQPELHAKAPYRSAMLTYPGNLRQALKDAMADPSKTLMGVAHGIPSTFVTKVLAATKPDFVWIDVEHGMFNRLELHDAIHAAQHHSEGRSLVIVRVPKHDEVSLSTALDAGAAGIVIPHVETVEEVREFVKEMYYGPIGRRSFSPWTFSPGIADASLFPNDPYNVATSNNHVCIIPQIESVKGVENVDAIAAMPEIHGLMFGPGDYMIDAGLDLNGALSGVPHPTFVEAMTKFSTAAQRNGVPIFGGALSVDMVPSLIEQGYRAIAVQFDVWGLSRLVHGSLAQARASAKQFAGQGKAATDGTTDETVDGAAEEVANGVSKVKLDEAGDEDKA
uniref:macrophomate synthase intermolecular Diels-Alderase n=1 Tax=Macrophoma commelinae TaxID=108330 RepID=UPI000017DBAB|nr:Chain A, macrophomate synthase intermolecular Diels-Alderase [Macrophoma commelinae]